jgi:hypothetical protein
LNPRRAAAIGIIFPVIAVIYFAAPTLMNGHVDFAGVTMLIALGAAMSIMAYVLMAGQSKG